MTEEHHIVLVTILPLNSRGKSSRGKDLVKNYLNVIWKFQIEIHESNYESSNRLAEKKQYSKSIRYV